MWDLLEGHKNPAPLSWAWFGAVKMERRPLAYEETHRLLKYHTHNLVKPRSYFYESLPLPPEELEPVPPVEKPVNNIHVRISQTISRCCLLIAIVVIFDYFFFVFFFLR